MKIIVCVKQVPSSNEVTLDPIKHTIIRDGRMSVINPFDVFALEEALRICEKTGGEVLALSMGIPATERILRECIGMGACGAMLLSDRLFAGADTLATAYTLALGVQKLGGADLIICGKMATDGDTAQIGPELAENLHIPQITDVAEIIEITHEKIVCKKITDFGAQIVEAKLPALITVTKEINLPRMASIAGVKKSLSTKVEIVSAEELLAEKERIGLAGSPTQVVKIYAPQKQRECNFLSDGSESKIAQMHKILQNLGAIPESEAK